MGVSGVPGTVSLLDVRNEQPKVCVPLRTIHLFRRSILAACGICALLCSQGGAFTQVTLSPTAPQGLEESFIAATTAQFLAKVTKNPLAAHTYSITILGPNPAYQAPEAPPTTLEQALALGSTVYVMGFANGQDYQRHIDQNLLGNQYSACKTTDNCQDGLGRLSTDMYEESLSTPTILGGF